MKRIDEKTASMRRLDGFLKGACGVFALTLVVFVIVLILYAVNVLELTNFKDVERIVARELETSSSVKIRGESNDGSDAHLFRVGGSITMVRPLQLAEANPTARVVLKMPTDVENAVTIELPKSSGRLVVRPTDGSDATCLRDASEGPCVASVDASGNLRAASVVAANALQGVELRLSSARVTVDRARLVVTFNNTPEYIVTRTGTNSEGHACFATAAASITCGGEAPASLRVGKFTLPATNVATPTLVGAGAALPPSAEICGTDAKGLLTCRGNSSKITTPALLSVSGREMFAFSEHGVALSAPLRVLEKRAETSSFVSAPHVVIPTTVTQYNLPQCTNDKQRLQQTISTAANHPGATIWGGDAAIVSNFEDGDGRLFECADGAWRVAESRLLADTSTISEAYVHKKDGTNGAITNQPFAGDIYRFDGGARVGGLSIYDRTHVVYDPDPDSLTNEVTCLLGVPSTNLKDKDFTQKCLNALAFPANTLIIVRVVRSDASSEESRPFEFIFDDSPRNLPVLADDGDVAIFLTLGSNFPPAMVYANDGSVYVDRKWTLSAQSEFTKILEKTVSTLSTSERVLGPDTELEYQKTPAVVFIDPHRKEGNQPTATLAVTGSTIVNAKDSTDIKCFVHVKDANNNPTDYDGTQITANKKCLVLRPELGAEQTLFLVNLISGTFTFYGNELNHLPVLTKPGEHVAFLVSNDAAHVVGEKYLSSPFRSLQTNSPTIKARDVRVILGDVNPASLDLRMPIGHRFTVDATETLNAKIRDLSGNDLKTLGNPGKYDCTRVAYGVETLDCEERFSSDANVLYEEFTVSTQQIVSSAQTTHVVFSSTSPTAVTISLSRKGGTMFVFNQQTVTVSLNYIYGQNIPQIITVAASKSKACNVAPDLNLVCWNIS